jgi:transcriptional regulator with XRE-family HTH domain
MRRLFEPVGEVHVRADRRTVEQLDRAMWQRVDMRTALAARDVATVFRLLQRFGVSQRRIAALTGQSQSEVSEILGGRHVVSYDVLTRIADGLGVPRGQLGLAYDRATTRLVGAAVRGSEDGVDADVPGRLRTRPAQVGSVTPPTEPASRRPITVPWARVPYRVGLADVYRLEAVTAQLRALDNEFGGRACRDAVLAQVGWARRLLRMTLRDDVARAMHIAVTELLNLAGWTSLDAGMVAPARRHFARALQHARHVAEPSLVAKVLYCAGRLHLHRGAAADALRLFQLGQLAAHQSGDGRAAALLSANEAWAHALLGETRDAVACLAVARDEYGRTETDEPPAWMRFVGAAEMQALRATTLVFLPEPTARQRAEAIERLYLSTALRELPMARSRSLELTSLAYMLFEDGEVAQGLNVDTRRSTSPPVCGRGGWWTGSRSCGRHSTGTWPTTTCVTSPSASTTYRGAESARSCPRPVIPPIMSCGS